MEPYESETQKINESRYNIWIPTEKLAKFLLGIELRPENYNKILPKLRNDRNIIRTKYGLPPREMLLENPREYEHQLRKIANKIGVSILECGNAFEESPMAGGIFIQSSESGSLEDKIGVDINDKEIIILKV